MNYKRLALGFGIHSLSVRLSFLILSLCMLAGLSAAYLMLKSERRQQLDFEKQTLIHTSRRLAQNFDKLIIEKQAVAMAANQVVYNGLFSQPAALSYQGQDIRHMADGSWRSNDGISGAFSSQAQLSPELTQLFQQTEALWKNVAPTITQEFFNFYLITKDSFIRIAPEDWALEIEANHKFNDDIFFKIAAPAQNPNREPIWTPVYYDSIWQKWVTSLVVPLYRNDEFVGITGADFVLDDIFANFTSINSSDTGRRAFIFDKRGNVLVHPDYTQAILDKRGDMNTELNISDLLPKPMQNVIDHVIAKPKLENDYVDRFVVDGEPYLINVKPINTLGWYVAVYNSESKALSSLNEFGSRLFVLFIGVAIVVGVLLQQALHHLVIKRLYGLLEASWQLSRGDWTFRLPRYTRDEVGALSESFAFMASEISQLVEGLNQRIRDKEHAEKAARRLSKAVSFSGSAVAITNANLQIEYVNPKLLDMTGMTEDELIGQPLLFLVDDSMAMIVADLEMDLRSRHHWRGDAVLRSTIPGQTWITLSVSPIREEDSTISSYVASAQDITFVKESQRKMEQLAYFDTLTGLANRTYFRMQLRKSMAMASRGNYAFALFYFDLDEFKRINDTLGHDSGDQLLQEVAERLRLRLRAEDTIARLGGDEFAVLLSGIKERDQAAQVANIIQETLSKPIKLGPNEVIISASIGITMAPGDSGEEDTLLKHADLAMYEAKAKGRNTYHFYSMELNEAARERLDIENELRLAIRNNDFELHYQPQVDSRDSSIIGYEALVRWHHPERGMIPPVKFIPVAESTGQIVEIGEWVIRTSCDFLARRQRQGDFAKVSLNLSARQFKDRNLVQLLSTLIAQYQIEPASLNLEITESMLMGDIDAAINQLHELKSLGLSLSIDDFGTGYSSLSYLKKFPVDTLKVDRSFVKDIPEDVNDMEIAAAIIAMAQKLNLDVVAEGVETAAQIEFLKNNSCYIVQGYFYSPPLPESKLAQFRQQLQHAL